MYEEKQRNGKVWRKAQSQMLQKGQERTEKCRMDVATRWWCWGPWRRKLLWSLSDGGQTVMGLGENTSHLLCINILCGNLGVQG